MKKLKDAQVGLVDTHDQLHLQGCLQWLWTKHPRKCSWSCASVGPTWALSARTHKLIWGLLVLYMRSYSKPPISMPIFCFSSAFTGRMSWRIRSHWQPSWRPCHCFHSRCGALICKPARAAVPLYKGWCFRLSPQTWSKHVSDFWITSFHQLHIVSPPRPWCLPRPGSWTLHTQWNPVPPSITQRLNP